MASVRERVSKSGERSWAVLFRHGSRQSSRTFKTQRAAEKFAKLVESLGPERALSIQEGERGPIGPTVDEVFAEWIAWKADRRDMTPRGLADYRRDWATYMTPALGHREAAMVTEADVQDWVDSLMGRISPKTIADRHALLHQVFAWAASRKRGKVPHNPCKETELPRKGKTVVRGLRMPEWSRLLTAMRAIDADAADFILFLASTGWRFSEAVALPVGAVEDDGDRVYVSLAQVARRGEGIVKDEGKSQAALRRVRVFGDAVPMIRRRVTGKRPDELVFTTARGSRWHHGPFRERKWLPAVEAAELAERGPTPHWLRHTHVALCVAAGMSLPEIQRRIGHENIQTTINVYGRMIDEMSDDVADRLDLLLSGRSTVVGEVVQPATEIVQLGGMQPPQTILERGPVNP